MRTSDVCLFSIHRKSEWHSGLRPIIKGDYHAKNTFLQTAFSRQPGGPDRGGGLTQPAAATTYHTITVDCNVSDFAPNENMGMGGMGTGQMLYVTWDANYLYVGISPVMGGSTVYIDTAPGGTSTASVGGTHQIAAAPQGYEYAYSNFFEGAVYVDGTSGGWIPGGLGGTLPGGTQFCAAGDVEWGIPWADIGVPPGTRLTILVTDRTGPDTVTEYWPVASGNDGNAPSFSQGFVFNSPMASGVSPGGSPTAVTLVRLVASTPQENLWLAAGLAALGAAAGAGLVIHRRKVRRQDLL